MAKEKIYIVKLEVKATTLKDAARLKNAVVFSVEESTQPVEDSTEPLGFNRK